jgi:DDE superfamily endonuclease
MARPANCAKAPSASPSRRSARGCAWYTPSTPTTVSSTSSGATAMAPGRRPPGQERVVELASPGWWKHPATTARNPSLGPVNSRTGQTHFLRRLHKRSADFQAFVDHVLIPAYADADFLFLIVDGSSIYKSKSTQQRLAARPQIVLVPLPSDAPRLNLQEQLWRWLRADVTHNHFFATFTALIAAAESFFVKLAEQPQAGVRRIGRAFPSLLDHHLATIL